MKGAQSSSELQIFSELFRACERIHSGIKGKDFLVLEKDDEMYGYDRTPLETDFCSAVGKVLTLLEERGPTLLNASPEYGFDIITALVQTQPAVDAYRSRMFRYATDWGSEVSPVGNCQREFFIRFRELLPKLKEESKRKMYDKIPNHMRTKNIVTYYWTGFDSHGTESIRVIDLFSL